MTFAELLESPPKIVNVGISDFAEALRMQDADVVEVRWEPPPRLEPEIERLLDRLL